MKERCACPVIVLTARTELDERLQAFELGAVDFVPKPFFMRELLARVDVHLGRKQSQPTRVFQFDNVQVDFDARTVALDNEQVSLTPHEFNLLRYLVDRRGRAVSRATLAADALSFSGSSHERTVDSHIAHLRKKLKAAGQSISTVWSIGYRFDGGDS
jgi:two-component system, OmpR family, response regulator